MCWDYDDDHLVTQWTDYLGARHRFEYDPHQRLVRIESPGERVQRFSYDALGRMTELSTRSAGSVAAPTICGH